MLDQIKVRIFKEEDQNKAQYKLDYFAIANYYLALAEEVGLDIEFLDTVNELLASDANYPLEWALVDAAWDWDIA